MPHKTKEDRAAYAREYYQKNRETQLTYRRQYRRNNLAALRAYKAEHGCADCGETDPIVLTFDHRDDDKSFNIAQKVGRLGLAALMAEVEKCEVRCYNCHMRRHYAPEDE